MARVVNLAVFVSGAGTTLEGLADRIRAGTLPAQVALVVADRLGTTALDRARRRGFDTIVCPLRTAASGAAWTASVTPELERRDVDLVILAGFLGILPREFLARFPGRVLNLHPSLLPKYGGPGMFGLRVHAAVLGAGDRETGVTVHLVTEAVDAGPILWQVRVPVQADDTPERLRARLHPIEVEALSTTIRRFATGDLSLPPRAGSVGD